MNYENNVENKIDFYPYLNINDSHNNKSIIDSINFLGYSYNFIKIPAINEDINGHQSNLLFNSVNLANSIDNNSSFILTPSPKKKFIIFHKKKRGRERTKTITYIKNIKIHNKLSDDNIIRKCQVSYINFIIEFMNILCSKFNINQTFFPLDYQFKKIINKKYRNKLISQSIEDIIKNNISPKYSTKEKSSNKEICEIIRKKGLTDFINILNKRFLFFFDKIYFTSRRRFNLKQFNLADIEIELSNNVELYENLLDKNKNDKNYKEYKEKMEKIIQKYFLPKVNKYFFECH